MRRSCISGYDNDIYKLTFGADLYKILLLKYATFIRRGVMEIRKVFEYHSRLLIFGFLTCTVLTGYCNTSQAADWPNWRGPNHNGISSETGWAATWPKGKIKPSWRAFVGTGFSSFAVSNGRAYTMGNIKNNDILYCFNAETGEEIWKKSYKCPLFRKDHEGGPVATPTVDGDAVYTFSKNGDVLRFTADTGRIIWHKYLNREFDVKHPTWYFAGSPLIIDNIVILNAGTYGYALDKVDGSLIWENGNGPCGYATAVPYIEGNLKRLVMVVSREIVGLSAATGRIIWKLPWRTSYDINAADSIISGDKMFISSGYNKGCALFKINGGNVTELWRNKYMRNHFNSCVLWNGYIYGFDGQAHGRGQLRCLSYQTGKVQWQQKGMGTGSLMLADGRLIILSETGKLIIALASPEGFKELSSAHVLTGKCWTMPVLANGRIYARNANGHIVCVDVSIKGGG